MGTYIFRHDSFKRIYIFVFCKNFDKNMKVLHHYHMVPPKKNYCIILSISKYNHSLRSQYSFTVSFVRLLVKSDSHFLLRMWPYEHVSNVLVWLYNFDGSYFISGMITFWTLIVDLISSVIFSDNQTEFSERLLFTLTWIFLFDVLNIFLSMVNSLSFKISFISIRTSSRYSIN